MSFERNDYIPDAVAADLRKWESEQDRLTEEYERKLAEFKRDPYSYCEWNIDAFSKYDLLAVALEYLLPDFDPDMVDEKAGQCNRKDILAAIRDSVDKVEL